MSQQLLMWSVSPFLIQQLEIGGVVTLAVFFEADEDNEDFEAEEFAQDFGIELSEIAKLNTTDIVKEAIAAEERNVIEIQGNYAEIIHFLLAGDDFSTLAGVKSLDFIVREYIADESRCLLVNALVGSKKVKDAEDYVASYLSPTEVREISMALLKIEEENFKERCQVLFSPTLSLTDYELAEAKDFIHSELIPLYSSASEQGYGILIAWSI